MCGKTKAVSYSRVSGKGQVEGYGFDRQEESIKYFAERNGYELVDFYKEEGISGTTEEEGGSAFKEMLLTVIRQKIDFIIMVGIKHVRRMRRQEKR